MSTRVVSHQDKSFPASAWGKVVSSLDIRLSDFSTPLFTVEKQTMQHNIEVMAEWVSSHGLELMPHGKTTMSPELWFRQLRAGATGITVATGWQALIALEAGVGTVQIANMCTDPRLLQGIDRWLQAHPEQELVLWVDSVEGVERMESALPEVSRIGVLVELGADGGRTGMRDFDHAIELANRVDRSSTLTLRGVGGYEGALGHDRSDSALKAVSEYCDQLVGLCGAVRNLVVGEPWITAGGSAYFDLVAQSFASLRDSRKILRSGAYIVHDSGFYKGISPLDETAGIAQEEALLPAMFGYARVVSRPEPGLALLDAGKRDMPFDEGLPIPISITRDLGEIGVPLEAEITALNDQHAFMRWSTGDEVEVGDVVKLGLSHPCTAFDKWRLVPEVGAAGIVTSAVETYF